MRRLTLNPAMVDVLEQGDRATPVCHWIGTHIQAVNQILQQYLNACHDCFHSWERRSMRVLAMPLAQSFGIDGLCNLQTKPITILIDVGRVVPSDWLGLVAHEYAHAHVGSPGHDQRFVSVLAHLCLGLGLEPPIWEPGLEEQLRHWPYANPTPDPLALWLGESGWESLWADAAVWSEGWSGAGLDQCTQQSA